MTPAPQVNHFVLVDGTAPGDPTKESLQTEYTQVCENFRALADTRFKLLGFLPVVAAGGLFLTEKATTTAPLVAGLGVIGTIASWLYNDRNDQFYDDLIGRAKVLEEKLDIHDGAFAMRPGTWMTFRFPLRVPVEHRAPVHLLYGSSLVAWLTALFANLWKEVGRRDLPLAIEVSGEVYEAAVTSGSFLLAGTLTMLVAAILKVQRRCRKAQTRWHAKSAAALVREMRNNANFKKDRPDDGGHLVDHLVRLQQDSRGKRFDEARKEVSQRLDYFLESDRIPVSVRVDDEKAAFIVGKVSDHRSAWVLDCLVERREKIEPPEAKRWYERWFCRFPPRHRSCKCK